MTGLSKYGSGREMGDVTYDEHQIAWLTLASFQGFGSRTLAKLKQRYGFCAAALSVSSTELEGMGHETETIQTFNAFRQTFDIQHTLATLKRENIRFILITDAEYPPLLRQISDPPQALFVRGTIPHATAPTLSIVGTRSCTTYGRTVTQFLAADLARIGCTIVSGLALGIDTIAHEATLDACGACIAVLGTGIDDASLYPRANVRLAHRIIANGGAVISEFPPWTESLKFHFPLRNRIIAGLSHATIVTEAALKSGSLITAHLALSYNRDVLAVPGSITSTQSTGTNALLAQGATLCTSAQDVLALLHTPGNIAIPILRVDALPTMEQQLLRALNEPMRINDLARLLGTDIRTLQQRITSLELQGFLEMQHGQLVARSRLIAGSVD